MTPPVHHVQVDCEAVGRLLLSGRVYTKAAACKDRPDANARPSTQALVYMEFGPGVLGPGDLGKYAL